MNNETENIKLEDLGYNAFFQSNREVLGLIDFSVARVIAEYKEVYRVKGINGEYLAKITGKQIFNATKREDYPAVGDWVLINELDAERAVINKILPRNTILRKKYSDKQDTQVIAANVDVAFITESLDRDYNLNRLERYLVLVNEGNIEPTIILNKMDLTSEIEIETKMEKIKNRFNNVRVIPTSTITEQGLDQLVCCIEKGKTFCFLGSSGAGKSSLINKLLGQDTIRTKEISRYSGRGKHTTTGRDMYFLENGGVVIDNPGMREVGIADASAGIEDVFGEITTLSEECKYIDCTHTHEPGCAVLKAIEIKEFDEDKYWNYVKLKKESEYYEMTELEKRRKDRKFGQFVKKASKQFKK
jgi:ribosome biogenesis GTPase